MEQADLKVIFSEVLRGFSLVESPSCGTVRIKHFNNFDSAELDIKNRFFYDKAKAEGLPTRKEQIEFLIEENVWSEKKNREILDCRTSLAGLNNTKTKVFLQAHINQVNEQIKTEQIALVELEREKEELIGFTAEAYAARRINEHYIYNALLKENCEKLFSKEEFEELEERKLGELMGLYNKNAKKFQATTLKLVAVSPFYTNLFYLCDDNAQIFYGKALVELTFYQVELFGYGRYYKSMIQNSDSKVPDEVSQVPEKIVEWFESTKSAKETLDKSNKSGGEVAGMSLVGATKEDLKRLGLDSPNETISLAQKAAEKGGKLDMEDMIKLHGI
jgi:hypothetical protein|tara:strand:+ start:4380 stop:5375 length:996 start_codon:yes stop_codon:yes gene_type:complete